MKVEKKKVRDKKRKASGQLGEGVGVNICFINGEVGTKNRQIHLHKISTLHH